MAAAIATTLPFASANALSILELAISGKGFGHLSSAVASGGSAMGTLMSSNGVSVTTTSDLTNLAFMNTFDAIWVSNNSTASTSPTALSATEIANLQAFLGTGRNVVMLGDSTATPATTFDLVTWDTSILAVVGDTIATGVLTPFLTATANTISPPDDALLANMSSTAQFSTYSTATGTGSPTVLFNDGSTNVNVANVYGVGGGSALVILDTNWMTNHGTFGLNAIAGNAQFGQGIIDWLKDSVEERSEAPEPVTIALFGAGMIAIGAIRRRRKGATTD